MEIELFGNPNNVLAIAYDKVLCAGALRSTAWTLQTAGSDLMSVLKPTGEYYDRQTVSFGVDRITFNFAVGIYLPMILVVLVSYGTFYVDPGAVPARAALVIISLLCSITLYQKIESGLPASGTLTWVDVFCLYAIILNTLAVPAFLLTHHRIRTLQKKRLQNAQAKSPLKRLLKEGMDDDGSPHPDELDKWMRKWWPYLFAILILFILIPYITSLASPLQGSYPLLNDLVSPIKPGANGTPVLDD